MQIIKKCDKAASYIFLAAMLIHLAVMCGEYSIWEVPFRGRLLQLAFVLCAVKILMTYYDYLEWAMMAGMGILSVLSYLFTREKYVVYVVVLIFAAKSVDTKAIFKIILDTCIYATLIVAILALIGQGGTVSEMRDFGRGVVETRYSFGFSHANNFHGTLWYIFSLIILLYKEKLSWIGYTVMTVLNVVAFILSGSKAGFAVAMLLILSGALYRYANKLTFEKLYPYILGFVGFAGIIALTLVSVSVDYYKGYGPVMKKLDSITTGRMNLAYQSAYIGDWKLLTVGGNDKYPVDNGFAYLAAHYGIIVWLVFLVFIAALIFVTAKKKDGILFAVIISCVAYTFMESSFVLNDAYLLSNLLFMAAIYLLGEKKPPVAEN